MTKIYLLKEYENNEIGKIIEVSDEVATKLVKENIGRLTFNKDYLVKPATSFKNFITRAFKQSPKNK